MVSASSHLSGLSPGRPRRARIRGLRSSNEAGKRAGWEKWWRSSLPTTIRCAFRFWSSWSSMTCPAAADGSPTDGRVVFGGLHPELENAETALLDLLCLEYELRQQCGLPDPLGELTGRFPSQADVLRLRILREMELAEGNPEVPPTITFQRTIGTPMPEVPRLKPTPKSAARAVRQIPHCPQVGRRRHGHGLRARDNYVGTPDRPESAPFHGLR